MVHPQACGLMPGIDPLRFNQLQDQLDLEQFQAVQTLDREPSQSFLILISWFMPITLTLPTISRPSFGGKTLSLAPSPSPSRGLSPAAKTAYAGVCQQAAEMMNCLFTQRRALRSSHGS